MSTNSEPYLTLEPRPDDPFDGDATIMRLRKQVAELEGFKINMLHAAEVDHALFEELRSENARLTAELAEAHRKRETATTLLSDRCDLLAENAELNAALDEARMVAQAARKLADERGAAERTKAIDECIAIALRFYRTEGQELIDYFSALKPSDAQTHT